ncbi:MAG: hypothetical protein ACK5IQ_09245 [Bacteroidales bacterium]
MNKSLKLFINIAVLLLVAALVWFMIKGVNRNNKPEYAEQVQETPDSKAYTKLASFDLPEDIERFELEDDRLFISAGKNIYIYSTEGQQQTAFGVKGNPRDLDIEDNRIYILYPASIEVYNYDGEQIVQWDACSELSDYCSITVVKNGVFVTDAENKNICKYTTEGAFVKFISSPNGFIIPSYTFDIENYTDTIYCVNSGRHKIEVYTTDGEFVRAFGEAGTKGGAFVGCCNPAYISFSENGQILCSEKGIPRISLFERNGTFNEVLLNSSSLGGGSKAYEVKTLGNKLFVGGKKTISVMQRRNR